MGQDGVSLKRIGIALAIVLGGVPAIFVAVGLVARALRDPEEEKRKADALVSARAAAEAKGRADAEGVWESFLPNRLAKESSLAGAVGIARSKFRDAVGSEPDPAAEALAGWAVTSLTWKQFEALTPTTFALAQKDVESARGRYVCAKGSIIEIRTDRSKWGKAVDRGLLGLGSGAIASFVSVGSSGALVVHSAAGFCGVVTGTWQFPNVSGGVTQTVHLVGMFNLPENWGDLASSERRP